MSCAEESDFPSFADVESKFGKAGTILLYSFSSIILRFNIVLFSFSVYSFIKSGYLTKSQVPVEHNIQDSILIYRSSDTVSSCQFHFTYQSINSSPSLPSELNRVS